MALPHFVKVGASFRDSTNPNHPEVWHVRGIVDDMAVCRRWRASKRRWEYSVLEEEFFAVREGSLLITKTTA